MNLGCRQTSGSSEALFWVVHGSDHHCSPTQAKKTGRIAGRGKDFFDGGVAHCLESRRGKAKNITKGHRY
jgi:hypothetical protein